MANFGLIAYGSYLPFQAISRQSIFDQIGWIQGSLKAYAKGKRSYADWDEDAVTLAVAAARQLLKTADNT
ncbi:MAG: 3-hydroxy-3-methylglutaryl CoA synthase, partial [Pseudomonadota bacterium]|nr:3-hydroxy-3-methylglutaryl CoA synthase [Pseudomonadota bacterium]